MEAKVREWCTTLGSDKCTERRRSQKAVKEALGKSLGGDSELCAALSSGGRTSWTKLFEAVHESVLKECDKSEATADTHCSSLLLSVVSSANKFSKHVDPDKLAGRCMEILRCGRFSRAIGNTYVLLLNKHVLCIDHYIDRFTPHTWADLLDVAAHSCNNLSLELSKTVPLLVVLIKTGSQRCHLALPVRDNLDQIKNAITNNNFQNRDNLQEFILEMMVLICDTIAAESRLTLCNFIEDVIPLLLKFYEKTSITYGTKKKYLFKFLHQSILIHHPKGRIGRSSGCLAGDWNLWNNCLILIYQLVIAESFLIEDHYKKSKKSLNSSNETDWYLEYIRLLTEICHQVFNTDILCRSTEEEPSGKKIRLDHHNFSTFHNIVENSLKSTVPWLEFVENYVLKYNSALSENEKFNLTSKLLLIFDTIDSLGQNVSLQIMARVFNNTIVDFKNDSWNDLLNKLWISALRKCSVGNDLHSSYHSLIQGIMRNPRNDLNLDILIQCYTGKAMPFSSESINSLDTLLTGFNTVLTCEESRLQICDWIFSNYRNFSFQNHRLISSLLFKLSLKNNPSESIISDETDTLFQNIFEDRESFMLMNDFEFDILITDSKKDSDTCAGTDPCVVWQQVFKVTLNNLSQNISKLVECLEDNKLLSSEMVYSVIVALKYVSFCMEQNIISQFDDVHDLKIQILSALKTINNVILERFQKLSSDKNKGMELLNSIECLYANDYHESLLIFIREITSKELVELFCNILDVNEDVPDNAFSIINQEVDNQVLNNPYKSVTINILTRFSTKQSLFTDDIFGLILQKDFYDMNKELDLVLNTISYIVEHSLETAPLNLIFNLLKDICKDNFRDSKASYDIMLVFYKILKPLSVRGTSTMKENSIIILQSYMKRCIDHYYTPRMLGLVLKCVSWIINESTTMNVEMNLFENTLKCVSSNIQSTRMYSCLCLSHYIAKQPLDEYEKFIKLLVALFNIDTTDLNPNIISDESANRTTTVFYSLASISVRSKVWSQISLCNIVKIAYDKKIDNILLKKVIKMICKCRNDQSVPTLILQNLNFLINYLYKVDKSIDACPWFLMDFQSLNDFLVRFKNIVIPFEWMWMINVNERKMLDIITNATNKSPEDVIQECLPNFLTICLSNQAGNLRSSNLKAILEKEFGSNCNFPNEGVIRRAVNNNIDKIIYDLLILINDEHGIFIDFNWKGDLPYCFKPTITKKEFIAIIDYLNNIFEINFYTLLCNNSPKLIQELLLKVWTNIGSRNAFESKLLSLYYYWVICATLPLETPLNDFICHFVINSVVALMGNFNDDRNAHVQCVISCKILRQFLNSALPKSIPIMNKLLPTVISTLVTVIIGCEQKRLSMEVPMELLKYIYSFKDRYEEIFHSIGVLPNMTPFNVINGGLEVTHSSLHQEIQHFINNDYKRNESLNSLYKALIKHSNELSSILQNIKNIHFFSDCNKYGIIHQLIISLLNIISDSSNENLFMETCRCLGVLGPCDLQTLILNPQNDSNELISDPLKYFMYTVLSQLKNRVFDPNSDIMTAVSLALESILQFIRNEMLDNFVTLEKNGAWKNILLPFMKDKKVKLRINISLPLFATFVDRSEIWYDFDTKNHTDWIVDIVSSLLKCFSEDQSFFSSLISACVLCPTISEKCFPSLIGLLLHNGNKRHIKILNRHIQTFFDVYYESTFKSYNHESSDSKNGTTGRQSKIWSSNFTNETISCMIELVQFIRLQFEHYNWSSLKIPKEEIFSLNYLPIAWAAYSVGFYFVAILFCELWCLKVMNNVPTNHPEIIEGINMGQDMLSILRMCYKSINDEDALSGCGSAHFSNLDERRNHYMFTKSHGDALLLHDISLSSLNNHASNALAHPNSPKEKALKGSFMQCLKTSGFYHLTEKYIRNTQSDGLFDDVKYDCFWRLGNWDLEFDEINTKFDSSKRNSLFTNNSEDLWPAYHYLCLKNTLSRDIENVDYKLSNALDHARNYVVTLTNCNKLQSSESFYKLNLKFRLLHDIEYFATNINNELNENTPFSNLIVDWSADKLFPFSDFSNIEPILSQRVLIFKNIPKYHSSIKLKLLLSQSILEYADIALSHKAIPICYRWISDAAQVCHDIIKENSHFDEVKKINASIQFIEGRAAWISNHPEVALHLLKSLIVNKEGVDSESYAKILLQYGSWMMETRQENPKDILNNYFELSLSTLGPNGNLSSRVKSYFAIAKFADEEYKQIDTYIKSPAFLNKIKLMEKSKNAYNSLREKEQSKKCLTKDERKVKLFSDHQNYIDKVEIQNTKMEKVHYLQLALRYYLQTLLEGDDHDLSIFRVTSLWLDNQEFEFDHGTETTLNEYLKTIPSRKFILVVPQLAPRMDINDDCSFQKYLHELMERCAMDHPYHTLPTLFSLKNSYKDNEFIVESSSCNPSKFIHDTDAYIASAKKIIQKLSVSNIVKISSIICDMEKLNLALIKLANFKICKENMTRGKKYPISGSQSICGLRQISNIPVPTVNIPISHSCDYNDIPTIISFSNHFTLVGGVNAPKKISCMGSDGVNRDLLLKGEDDIRQDAVMQQVFGIVNQLLARNQLTEQKHLFIRTYKIVVLSRHSGVIEWCNGTDSIGHLLVGETGTGGYHGKYRPNDMKSNDARRLMQSKRDGTNSEKLIVFKKILSNLKPVFHMFFVENFLSPAVWYERRLAYTGSVASSCMIGYILGLGDRHVQNILIDKSTAEIIHIDLGIAFEQGRLQPTPETVPFRLTQNFVAGFGCTGAEGIFKRLCEKTMDVLKMNQEILVTILEVLLCDPLHLWKISQKEAYAKQNVAIDDIPIDVADGDNENSIASEAERALLRVKSKLEGTEFGCMLATSGQVSRLIQQATDINNLSRLFQGWQPYL